MNGSKGGSVTVKGFNRTVRWMQNQDGAWCVDFLDEGAKRRRRVVGDGTSEDAAKIEAKRKARELSEKLTTERNPDTASVETVLEAYFKGNPVFDTIGLLNKVSTLTAQKYHAAYRHFKEYFPGQVGAFRELTKVHVEGYLQSRQASGAAPKTILAEFITLRTLVRWAAQEYEDEGRHFFLRYDITANVKPPKVAERLPVYLTDLELARMFGEARKDAKLRAIVSLGYYHGLRTSSIARLKTADVTLGENVGEFRVWKKAGGQVNFGLHPEALAALRECPAAAGSEYWFGDEWAQEPSYLSAYLCAWLRSIGIHKRFHDLRHTCAHTHVMAGTPAPLLQRALGHGDLKTTQGYIRLWEAEVKEVASRMPTVGGEVNHGG
jgi:integrase